MSRVDDPARERCGWQRLLVPKREHHEDQLSEGSRLLNGSGACVRAELIDRRLR